MKAILIKFIGLFLVGMQLLQAQNVFNRIELGLSAQGVSEYVDLNESSTEVLTNLAFHPALVVRYNLPYRFAIRAMYASLSRSVTQALDEGEIGLQERGYFAMIGEFHFNDFNSYRSRVPVTPYLGIGLSGLLRELPESTYSMVEFSKLNYAATMSFGAKMKLNRIVLASELASGIRLGTKEKSLLKDWYVFPNFTITYTFGPNF